MVLIDRRGTIEGKNTISDFRDIEHERLNSIYSTVLYTEYLNHKINFIDNPGIDDFIGEVFSAFKVCESSILVLNTQNAVETGTEILWRHAKNFQ